MEVVVWSQTRKVPPPFSALLNRLPFRTPTVGTLLVAGGSTSSGGRAFLRCGGGGVEVPRIGFSSFSWTGGCRVLLERTRGALTLAPRPVTGTPPSSSDHPRSCLRPHWRGAFIEPPFSGRETPVAPPSLVPKTLFDGWSDIGRVERESAFSVRSDENLSPPPPPSPSSFLLF